MRYRRNEIMKKWGFWKVTMWVMALLSLGASVYESNTAEAVPMLKEVAQSCFIVALVGFCFAYLLPLGKNLSKREEHE